MNEFSAERALELLEEIYPGNHRHELIRIKQDLDVFGFQNFFHDAMDRAAKVSLADAEWNHNDEKTSLETRVSSAANLLVCLFEYYFDDEEPAAIYILQTFTSTFYRDIANKHVAIKSLWTLMVDLHWRAESDHRLDLNTLGNLGSCYYSLFLDIIEMDTPNNFHLFPWSMSEHYFHLDKEYHNIFKETSYEPIFLIILCLYFFLEGRDINEKQMAKEIEKQLADYRTAIENDKNITEEFYDKGEFFDEDSFTSFKEFLLFCNSVASKYQDFGAVKDEFDNFISEHF